MYVFYRETLWSSEMPAELGIGAGLVSTTINLDALTEDTRVHLHFAWTKLWGVTNTSYMDI